MEAAQSVVWYMFAVFRNFIRMFRKYIFLASPLRCAEVFLFKNITFKVKTSGIFVAALCLKHAYSYFYVLEMYPRFKNLTII
jgi:hypothetical protein